MEFLRTGEIEVDGLSFNKIEGILYMNDTLETLHRSTTISSDILSDQFVSALLHKIEIHESSLPWYKTSGDTIIFMSFDNCKVIIEELYSDSTLIKEERGASNANLNGSLENFRGGMINNYDLKSDKIFFTSRENRLSVINLSLTPTQEKVDSKNYFELDIGRIDLLGLSYDSLIQKDVLIIDKLSIAEPDFTYIRPPQPLQKDTLRFLPAITFKSIPMPLHMDTLEIRNIISVFTRNFGIQTKGRTGFVFH